LESRRGYEEKLDPPWLFLNLSMPPEAQFLVAEPGSFSPIIANTDHGSLQQSIRDTRDHRQGPCWPRCSCVQASRNNHGLATTKTDLSEMTAETFRDKYPLLDESGAEVRELEQPERLGAYRFRARLRLYIFIFSAGTLMHVLMRIVSGTCFHKYSQLVTMEIYAQRENVSMTEDLREAVRKDCDMWRSDPMAFERGALKLLPDKLKRSETSADIASELDNVCKPSQNLTLIKCIMHNHTLQAMLSRPRAFGVVPCVSPFCISGAWIGQLDLMFIIAPVAFFATVAVVRTCMVYMPKRKAATFDDTERC